MSNRLSLIVIGLFLVCASGCVPTAQSTETPLTQWPAITGTADRFEGVVPETQVAEPPIGPCNPMNPKVSVPVTLDIVVLQEDAVRIYCIYAITASTKDILPDLRIHLPMSMLSAEIAGAAWNCEGMQNALDDVLQGEHIDFQCRSVLAGRASPPVLAIMVPASETTEADRICAESLVKEESRTVCLPE